MIHRYHFSTVILHSLSATFTMIERDFTNAFLNLINPPYQPISSTYGYQWYPSNPIIKSTDTNEYHRLLSVSTIGCRLSTCWGAPNHQLTTLPSAAQGVTDLLSLNRPAGAGWETAAVGEGLHQRRVVGKGSTGEPMVDWWLVSGLLMINQWLYPIFLLVTSTYYQPLPRGRTSTINHHHSPLVIDRWLATAHSQIPTITQRLHNHYITIKTTTLLLFFIRTHTHIYILYIFIYLFTLWLTLISRCNYLLSPLINNMHR